MDFKESSMTEVKSIETQLNVGLSSIPYSHSDSNFSQNFFTNVKALISDAEGRQTESSGTHHYRIPEQELMQRYIGAS